MAFVPNDQYFAADEPSKTADVLLDKAQDWFGLLIANGYLEKLRSCYAAYHGSYYTSLDNGHQITFGGEQGELVNLAINHYRNIAENMINMVTSNRPIMQCKAVNTDYKSLVQAKLGNNLLEYYMRDKRLEEKLKTSVTYAVVLAAGFIKLEWNPTSGEVYDTDPETGAPIYEGDLEFKNLSPFDVVLDSFKEGQEKDWVMVRTFKNRFAMAAKYPELKDKILSLPTKNELYQYRFVTTMPFDNTDDIPVYEFFHRKDEAMPEGRYMLFLSSEIVLEDTPLLYPEIPIYRIAPADVLGTPYGYSPMFDILPIQEAINSLYSTVMTNQNAFGIQNIMVPRGADIDISSLAGGLNIIEGNFQAGEPKPVNFTSTPKEVFDFMRMLEQAAETISGINSVARGNPEASLRSGTALALVQSMALQFISGLQRQYVRLIEDLGTGIINTLKIFAAVPRVRAIAGKANEPFMGAFTGDDLSQINRVSVEVGNPMSRTTAGRAQMATELIQYGIISTPQQYFTVLNTGNLDVLMEGAQNHLLLIRDENESLTAGRPVVAVMTDDHVEHIKAHREVLGNPELRFDPELVQRVTSHIQEHIDLLRNTDPNLLTILGQQPLQSMMPQGAGPQMPPPPQTGNIQEGEQITTVDGTQVNIPSAPPIPDPSQQGAQ